MYIDDCVIGFNIVGMNIFLGGDGMTYTVEAKVKSHLTKELCKLADEIVPSGMIEEVLPFVVSFHNLKENDVQKAKNFIAEKFGNPECQIAKEHYDGRFCNLEYI